MVMPPMYIDVGGSDSEGGGGGALGWGGPRFGPVQPCFGGSTKTEEDDEKSLGDKIVEWVTCIGSIAVSGLIYDISEAVKAQLQLIIAATATGGPTYHQYQPCDALGFQIYGCAQVQYTKFDMVYCSL